MKILSWPMNADAFYRYQVFDHNVNQMLRYLWLPPTLPGDPVCYRDLSNQLIFVVQVI